MRILVTGAGGFIGHHLVARLREDGHYVHGVDLKRPGWSESAANEFCVADLRWYPDAVAVCKGMDWVFALAATMGGMGFISHAHAEIIRDNTLININTIEAARLAHVKRYLFTSSACVYPNYLQTEGQRHALSEGDVYPAQPQEMYGWEKLHAEHLCQAYREAGWLDTRVVRFHNVYGPCFADDTEILTEDNGFKLFSELTHSDRVATLNPETGGLAYQHPLAIQAYHYTGTMHHFRNGRIDLLVTPDHAMYCAGRRAGKFGRKKASDLVQENRSAVFFNLEVEWPDDEIKARHGFYRCPAVRAKGMSHCGPRPCARRAKNLRCVQTRWRFWVDSHRSISPPAAFSSTRSWRFHPPGPALSPIPGRWPS